MTTDSIQIHMRLGVLLVATLLTGNATAESLNQWLVGQVRADEQLLADALGQVNGHTLDGLKDSRTYVPFFLEPPEGVAFASAEQKASFDAWVKADGTGFLSGGYIYRLRFKTAPPLYALSAGDWSGHEWHSLALGKDISIEPGSVWEAANGGSLYATLLSGARPRLVVYDQQGDMQKQDVFDASAADVDRRLDAAVSPYSRNGKPALEIISMAEYLKNQGAPWRAVDLSGRFNLRNQQQRPDEQERLKLTEKLTRSMAVNALLPISTKEATSASNPPPLAQPPAPKQTPEGMRPVIKNHQQ
jgi:hypothetical protein